jgi:CheY-like chemotaxis protein
LGRITELSHSGAVSHNRDHHLFTGMPFHELDKAYAAHEALIAVFARELGGSSNPAALSLVSRLCDSAVDAVNDVDCRVAIRGVKSLATLLYSADGHSDVEAGALRGVEALRFQILNALSNFRGRLDVIKNRRPSRPEMPPLTAKALRVLVVEDNRDSADTLCKLLEICGCTVTVAYTARDGFEAAKRDHPDVILCDIGLPDHDGYALASSLKNDADTASARLVAITAYGSDLDRARSKKAGFEIHLIKPVHPEALLQQLQTTEQSGQLSEADKGKSQSPL